MAKITDDLRDKILSDFHIGKSQNWLANNYNLSPATINKLCKGLTPKYKDKVNDVVSIKSELSKESEYQSFTFDKEVNEQIRRQGLVFNATEKLLKKIDYAMEKHKPVEKVNIGEGIQKLVPVQYGANDYKNFADAIDKASITLGVNQRHSNSQVQINNSNNQQTNIEVENMSQKEIINAYLDIVKK